MITIRKAGKRFHTRIGWLDSWHSFSFGEHYDPAHMGFRSLRVINDDKVTPGAGFPTHPHKDMEIVTYVLDGAVAHQDSMGNGSTIRPGDVQRMTAGTGVLHSEFNPSQEEGTRLLQIWILPEKRNLEPGYEEKRFPMEDRAGRLRLVADREGTDGAVVIHQDARIYATVLAPGQKVRHDLARGRGAWVQVARGAVSLNGTVLGEGDGAAVEDEPVIDLSGAPDGGPAEVLLFDLA